MFGNDTDFMHYHVYVFSQLSLPRHDKIWIHTHQHLALDPYLYILPQGSRRGRCKSLTAPTLLPGKPNLIHARRLQVCKPNTALQLTTHSSCIIY